MGQKVNPNLIRFGIPSANKNQFFNPITSPQVDLFRRKDRHSFPTNFNGNSYGKKLEASFLLEKSVEEFFFKSGYIINQLQIRQSYKGFTIYVDAYLRKGTSQPFDQAYLSSTSPSPQRKVSWTARKTSWRSLTGKDLYFCSKFFQKYITYGIPVFWKFRPLNTSLKIRKNSRRLYQEDAEQIFQILAEEPAAELLATFMSLELKDLQSQQPFIDFIFEGVNKLLENNSKKLMGALITVKGRINGSDRSKKSSFRKGSLPLQTFDAAIDYSMKEVITRYGVCSIKVWLRYILYILLANATST